MSEEKIKEILDYRNIRPTAMRILVLKILNNQKTAVSLPELEIKLFPADKTTLFRTLKIFEKHKLIHKIDDGSGIAKYALCDMSCNCKPEELHVHFYCTKCSQTYCLNDVPVPEINLPTNFTLESVNIVVKGICANCKM